MAVHESGKFTKAKDLEYRGNGPMLTLKLQAWDYELTLLPHKSKSDPFPKQSQDQSLFQAEHFILNIKYGIYLPV